MDQTIPKTCPFCSAPVVEKSGVSKKTNKEYHFWGCSNFPECRYVYREEAPKTGGLQKAVVGGNEEIIKGLREIWIELEKLNKNFNNFCQIFGEKKEK